MKVYFLSGLGADKTVFQFLDLDYCEPIFIEWITPNKNETLEAYALRLKEVYNIPDNAVIVGLSFGGMLTTEIAKTSPYIKAVLISSAKTKNELPPFYRMGKHFSLHNIAPAALQRWFMLHIKWLFGLKSPQYIKVYEALIQRSDTNFNNWAVTALLNWENTLIPENIVHIHGTHDRILPYKYVSCAHTIKKGGHLMVMGQASIVSAMLKEIITAKEHSVPSSSTSQPAPRYQV